MRINLKILVLIAAVIVVAAVTGRSNSLLGPDPGQPDFLTIDSITGYSSGLAVVPIRFTNDEELAGIEITLHHSSTDLVVDSFSFAGGRASAVSVKGWTINADNLTIYCLPFSDDPLIPAGSGLLGAIYFSYPPSAGIQLVGIDTATYDVGDLMFSTAFSDSEANAFAPQFQKGFIDLQLGNCCIGQRGNINGDTGEKVNISDITYLVNYLFGVPLGPEPSCMDEADINADGQGRVNITDLTYLIAYLFGGGPAPASCP